MIALLLAMTAFQMGVNVSDRGDIPNHDLLVQFYYAIGLFTLGGMDLGMPIEGPVFWRWVLLFDYFFAPIIAAAAVIEGLYLTIHPWMILHWPWKNHIIVAGGGRISLVFVQKCLQKFPGTQILVVEREEDFPNKEVFRSLPGVFTIHGNIDDAHLIQQLRIPHSRFILLMTSDEVANLETAFFLLDQNPKPLLIRTVDLRLIEQANRILPAQSSPPCINIHQVVAQSFERQVQQFLHGSTEKDIVVFSGFGRFSQTFLRNFVVKHANQVQEVWILDPKAQFCWAIFEDSFSEVEQSIFSSIPVHCLEDKQRDPRAWKNIFTSHITQKGQNLIVLFGTNQDQENLRCALWLSEKYSRALIAVRMFQSSRFAKELTRDNNVRLIDSAEILKEPIDSWLNDLDV